jgi:hypothetical protein
LATSAPRTSAAEGRLDVVEKALTPAGRVDRAAATGSTLIADRAHVAAAWTERWIPLPDSYAIFDLA